MKARFVVTVSVAVLFALMLAVAIGASTQQGLGASLAPEDESNAELAADAPERYRSTGEALPAAAEEVYFAPQDNTDNTTVISLYSTRNDDADVKLETFRLDGSTLVAETVTVPARGMVRIVSDQLVTPPSGDWGQAIYIQFFNTSAFARLTLPEGIKADAYIAWTNSLDYDPENVVASLSLRFSK